MYTLSEEHDALREAVRALADDKIAPRAADVDRTSEFPWDVYEALVKADLQAVHIPEAYGGAGADAIATAIVIEEVARPFSQMTRAELDETRRQIRRKIRELQQPARDAKLRRGVAKPRNRAEWKIFAADLLKETHDGLGD